MKLMNQSAKYQVLRLPRVKNLTGLSRSAIYKRISEGSFPKQIDLGGRAVGWLESDVETWIKSRSDLSKQGGNI